jgi:hypothetical protein
MGLDAYLHYQCSYRPNGSLHVITENMRLVRMLSIMNQRGVPQVTFQLSTPRGVQERTVTRAEAEKAAANWEALGATCKRCPVSNGRATPGCQARVNYPIDDVALQIVREALEINAQSFEAPADGFVRSLVAAGNCSGQRIERVVRSVNAQPSAIGNAAVQFVVNEQEVNVTPYMALEHLFFRAYLNPAQVLEVREWYRAFYAAIGDRIAEELDPKAAAGQLFGSSQSLQDLNELGALVNRAEQEGLGLVLDG